MPEVQGAQERREVLARWRTDAPPLGLKGNTGCWCLLVGILASSLVTYACSLDPPEDRVQAASLPLSRDEKYSAVSQILRAADLKSPAMVVVLDSRSLHDRAAIEWMGESLLDGWASRVLVVNPAINMVTSLEEYPDSWIVSDVPYDSRLGIGGLGLGIYGIPERGVLLESLGPISRRHIAEMHELLSSGQALNDGYRKALVESIEDVLTERLRAEFPSLETGEVPKLLLADVCTGCPSGRVLEEAIREAGRAGTSWAIFIPEGYRALRKTLKDQSGIHVFAYRQDEEPLGGLLIASELLGISFPLALRPDQDWGQMD